MHPTLAGTIWQWAHRLCRIERIRYHAIRSTTRLRSQSGPHRSDGCGSASFSTPPAISRSNHNRSGGLCTDCCELVVHDHAEAPQARRTPRVGLGHTAISQVVRRALIRAQVDSPRKGAHLFRHTLATEMLGRGASLTEIGQILRHQHPRTTMIYAKVDVPVDPNNGSPGRRSTSKPSRSAYLSEHGEERPTSHLFCHSDITQYPTTPIRRKERAMIAALIKSE